MTLVVLGVGLLLGAVVVARVGEAYIEDSENHQATLREKYEHYGHSFSSLGGLIFLSGVAIAVWGIMSLPVVDPVLEKAWKDNGKETRQRGTMTHVGPPAPFVTN